MTEISVVSSSPSTPELAIISLAIIAGGLLNIELVLEFYERAILGEKAWAAMAGAFATMTLIMLLMNPPIQNISLSSSTLTFDIYLSINVFLLLVFTILTVFFKLKWRRGTQLDIGT